VKGKSLKPFIVSVISILVISGLIGWITSGSMAAYEAVQKSSLTPPSFVFPIVWTILYVLMGIGAAMIYQSDSPKKKTALRIFIIQLLINYTWSILFFNLQLYGLAFFWLLLLWALIIAMIVWFWSINQKAALLQIPYLIWVTFAGYLAFVVWMLN